MTQQAVLGSEDERPDYTARLSENIEWLRDRRGLSLKRLSAFADIALNT